MRFGYQKSDFRPDPFLVQRRCVCGDGAIIPIYSLSLFLLNASLRGGMFRVRYSLLPEREEGREPFIFHTHSCGGKDGFFTVTICCSSLHDLSLPLNFESRDPA